MTQTTISNLNQALQCAGKCDCCDKLQQQINNLNQRINNIEHSFIHKSERMNIVNESAIKAEHIIMPAVGIAIARKVSPVAKIASEAMQLASSASSGLAGLLSKLAPLLSVVAVLVSLASAAGTLLVLGNRIDALEGQVQAQGNDLSKAFGLIFQIKNTADSAKALADKAIRDVAYVQNGLDALRIYVNNELRNLAQSLRDEIKFLTESALAAMQRLENYINQQINFVQESVRIALGRVHENIAGLQAQINQIKGKISILEQTTVNLYQLIFKALQEAYNYATVSDVERVLSITLAVSRRVDSLADSKQIALDAKSKAEQALKKAAIPGPRGLQGIQGKQGIQGIQGKTGERGKDGINGKDGKFDMAELAGVMGLLGVIQKSITQGNTNVINQVKTIKPEIVASNKKLATDLATTVGDSLCTELQNGRCLTNGLNSWFNQSPLVQIGSDLASVTPVTSMVTDLNRRLIALDASLNAQLKGQALALRGADFQLATLNKGMGAVNFQLATLNKGVGAANFQLAGVNGQMIILQGTATGAAISLATVAAGVAAMKPVVINTGNQITNLGDKITYQGNQITNLGDKITYQTNQVTKQGNQITNQGNRITNLGDKITYQNTQVTKQGNQITNLGDKITYQGNQITNLGDKITYQGNQITNLGDKITYQNTQITNQGNQIQNITNNINNTTNAIPIAGSITTHSCTANASLTLPYAGLGLLGIQAQIHQVSTQIETLAKTCCRTYRILGGNDWFKDGENPNYRFNPELSIKSSIKQAYREQLSPSVDAQPLTIQVRSLPYMLFGLDSATWRRSGLHRFPVSAPPSIMPNITRNPATGSIVSVTDWNKAQYIKITDDAAFQAYQFGQFKSIMGEFPISMKVNVEEGNKIVEKDLRIDNVSEAFTELIGLNLVIQDDLQLNTQLGMKSLIETSATKNAAIITQDLALSNAKYLGYQITRQPKPIKSTFTPGTTNIKEFIKDSQQQIITYAHKSGHLEHKLNTLLISAGITKAALTTQYKPGDDVIGGIIAKDALAKLEKQEDDWKLFLKLLREPVGDMKIDGVPLLEVEDLTEKLKQFLRGLQ